MAVVLWHHLFIHYFKMNKIKSNPSQTILVIVSGLLFFHLFSKIDLLLNIILVLCLIGAFSSYWSRKVEIIWFKLAYLLGLIIPNITLGIIFYFFLFPIALLSRITSNDPLFLKNNYNTIYKNVNKSFNKESFKNLW